ncbi:MAG: enoyl-[acyl-carrier-protein] reductase FabK [Oscillospiraceae bacterium]|jgi:enoyl-[acyl-carrier protein] reductase II
MNTRITELLGIKHPIIQGGMAWVAESTLAAAVSNAGGLGLIAGGAAPIEYLREQIRNAKKLTDKPFGVNIMLMSPNAEELAQLVIDEGVPVVTTGAGNPGKYMEAWKGAGIKVIPVVPSVALAKRMERAGADAVVAEGTESGGHIGEITTMCLVPQVADAVSIPVIAAGGIADGRGIAASFMLGAEGVQVGTRFLVAEECKIHENYKSLVVSAKDTDSIVTGRFTGHPCRGVKTKFAKQLLTFEKEGGSPEEFENLTLGSLRKAAVDGNIAEGSFLCGAIAGMVNKIEPAKDMIEEMFSQAEKLLNK